METNRIETDIAPATETTNRLADPEPAAQESRGHRFRIPGDMVSRSTRDLPADQRDAIKWAHGYCLQRNITCGELGALLVQPGTAKPYSEDSIYQIFTGRRGEGSVERFVQAIDVLRKRIEETQARHASLFVETNLTREIFKACRTAYEKRRVVFIFGESQIGKTRSLEEYARLNNHGQTYLIRMPTNGSMHCLLQELAIRLGIPASNKGTDLRRRIIEAFDDRNLLIADECEQCVGGRDTALASLEFLREIADRRKCGLVLSGALSFHNAIKSHYTLRKLWLRGYRPLKLPSRPSQADLAHFTAAFGLPAAEDKKIAVDISGIDNDGEPTTRRVLGNPLALQQSVIKDYGLGRWLTILEDARDLARERNKRITWGLVITAHQLIRDVEELALT